MQHAEAQERLSDLALEPRRLARLDDDPSPEAGALRGHLAECGPCSADLANWRLTWAQVAAALQDPGPADDGDMRHDGAMTDEADVLRAPASLRAKTLARIAADGTSSADLPGRDAPSREKAGLAWPAGEPPSTGRHAPGQRRRTRRQWTPWVAMAAALVIAVGAGSLALTRTRDLDRAQAENAGLTATMASLDRVLGTPAHWTVTLRTPDGVDGGTVAWSGSEIAVITTALPGPAGGQSYRCWVERDGVRTPMGPMWFSGSTGYWAGAIDGWGPLLTPGARLGVSLVPAGGGPAAPVLIGTL